MAVVFEKLAEDMIEDIAKEVLGDIIQAIENLITNPKDNDTRSRFTQDNVTKASGLCSQPVNVMVVFSRVKYDASDLTNNGYKHGQLKCPCPAANNTLLYDCYVGVKAGTFHLQGDGGFLNWAYGSTGKPANRHGNDVSFQGL